MLLLFCMHIQNVSGTTNPLSYMNTNINSIYIPEIIINEIKTIIYSLKNACPGYDEMPASIVKQCIGMYTDPITFNKCIY